MSLCCLICTVSPSTRKNASTHSDREKQNKNTTDVYTWLLTNHSHICIHVFCTFSVLKVNSPSSCLHKTDGASSLIPKFSVFFSFESKCWFQWEVGYDNTILESFWNAGSITHAGCWWRHRSWERDPAWCSWWRWDGPHAKAAAPARLFPETETGQPAPHNLEVRR